MVNFRLSLPPLSGQFSVITTTFQAIDIDCVEIRFVLLLNRNRHLAVSANDFSRVSLGRLLYFFGNREEAEPAGNYSLDAIRELFPLFLGKRKIRSEIQYGALPWASLGSDGLDQFVSAVALPVLVVGMCGLSNEH